MKKTVLKSFSSIQQAHAWSREKDLGSYEILDTSSLKASSPRTIIPRGRYHVVLMDVVSDVVVKSVGVEVEKSMHEVEKTVEVSEKAMSVEPVVEKDDVKTRLKSSLDKLSMMMDKKKSPGGYPEEADDDRADQAWEDHVHEEVWSKPESEVNVPGPKPSEG